MAVATEPIINILGERVALGPLMREHIPLFTRWRNDFTVARTFGGAPRAYTIEAVTAIFDAGKVNDYEFAIYERATWRPIGRTYLFDVDWRGRTAGFGIVIGEADARGRGYGTEATRLMLDYAFTALGLHSVMLTTDSYNLAGQAAYRKAGFKEFGRRRECAPLNGTLHDWVYMDCLASEFVSPVLGAVFVPDTPR
ncbi:MAG TPA: GNAT family protein [Thermomicrobiales bacterium]|jgi:RimJ/RimL family protein N-acetyltransferase